MDEVIDTGPIVLSEGLRFTKSDKYSDIRIKVYKNREILLVNAVMKIIEEQLSVSFERSAHIPSYNNLNKKIKTQDSNKPVTTQIVDLLRRNRLIASLILPQNQAFLPGF